MFLLTWRLHNWKENDVFVIWHRTELQTHTKTTGRASGVKWRRWWRQRHWQPNWVGNLASSQIISMNAFINVPTKPRIWMDSYHCWKDQASFMFQFGGLRQLAFTMASSWVWHWGCLQCVSATYFLIQAYQIVTDQKEPLNNCCCCCCSSSYFYVSYDLYTVSRKEDEQYLIRNCTKLKHILVQCSFWQATSCN